jgi:transposase
VEVMRLIEKLTPDDKTICNFRKDNAAALKKVFRGFSLRCNRQGLYDKKLAAVDGIKVRANSSRKNIHICTHFCAFFVFSRKTVRQI